MLGIMLVCCQRENGQQQASGQAMNTVAAAAPRRGAYTYIHTYISENHFFPTTVVQQIQHVDAVGCHTCLNPLKTKRRPLYLTFRNLASYI